MTKGQETAQRLIAVVVIMAMLGVMGIPLTVILFFATVVYFVWRAVQRSEQQDVKNIFDFYVAANEILRDDEKRWYGFEISQVIGEGERVLHMMADPPPLVYFALGALYHRAGDHEAAAEQPRLRRRERVGRRALAHAPFAGAAALRRGAAPHRARAGRGAADDGRHPRARARAPRARRRDARRESRASRARRRQEAIPAAHKQH